VNIKSNFSKTITERVFDESIYMIGGRWTLKVVAKRFGVSITTVWRDMREKLARVNATNYRLVGGIINSHKKGVR
ncbi:unnamed protein product, partial [marine sediment metagenome]